MAIEKVGVYRKWLEPAPKKNGKSIPKSEWPKKRRHCWIVRWCGNMASANKVVNSIFAKARAN